MIIWRDKNCCFTLSSSLLSSVRKLLNLTTHHNHAKTRRAISFSCCGSSARFSQVFNILPCGSRLPLDSNDLFALIHQRGSRRALSFTTQIRVYVFASYPRVHEHKSRNRRTRQPRTKRETRASAPVRTSYEAFVFNHRGNVLQPNRDGPSDGTDTVVVPVAATSRDGCDRPDRYPVRCDRRSCGKDLGRLTLPKRSIWERNRELSTGHENDVAQLLAHTYDRRATATTSVHHHHHYHYHHDDGDDGPRVVLSRRDVPDDR